MQAIKDNIATDERCFELFLGAPLGEIPGASRDRLLSDIKHEHNRLMSVSGTSATPIHQQSELSESVFGRPIPKEYVLDKLEAAVEGRVLAKIEKEKLGR